jgi:hypothetical protein
MNATGRALNMYEGEDRRGAYRVWWENLRERVHLEDPGVNGRIILRRIFRKHYGGHGLARSVSR